MGKAQWFLTGPEAAAHKRQVMEHQCAHCRHRVAGVRAFGRVLWDCAEGRTLPKKGICEGFTLDETGGDDE